MYSKKIIPLISMILFVILHVMGASIQDVDWDKTRTKAYEDRYKY